MAVGSLRHQHQKGKFKMTSFRVICRSILNHPFLLVMLIFLICLHRYFPCLFFLLVSASPVIICAAILLGTLLIYGQPNDNNVKYHEEMSNTSVSLRTGVEDHTYSAEREGSFSKDRFAEVRKDIVQKGFRASGVLSSGISVNNNLTKEVDWEYCNGEFSKGSTIYKAESKNGFGFAYFEKADVQMHRDRGYDISIKANHDNGMQEKHPDDTVNHESSDCESDGADKSSFDALVADVIPTAQEACPLLDSEDPLDHDASHDASLKFELQSVGSNQSSEDSGDDENDDGIDENETLKAKDDDNKLQEQLESLITRTIDERDEEEVEDDESTEDVEVDDEYDDDEEEEGTNVGKDESKQVTMWTEEDEKNLRLVGNSELERDLRLENLLARRRAKRNFSMISERNLIDLDRPEIPFQVPPISTTRVNPFDTPVNTNQQFSIPPIPGSAPSVSVPRRNPFESPCTSPKGIQNLTAGILKEEPVEMNLNNAVFHEIGSSSTGCNPMGNVLKPDFVEINRKDAVFRRYESFSTGYNFIGDASRQDLLETDRKNAVFRRHETFNTRSAFPNFVSSPEKVAFLKMKPVFVPEHVVRDQEVRHPSSGRESSHDSESIVSSSESDHTETPISIAKHEGVGPNEDLIAESDHASRRCDDTSSESSDTTDSLHDHPGEEYVGSAEVNADHIYQIAEAIHENEDDASSSTSMTSEEDHSSEKMDQDEDETVNETEFSPKASSSMSDVNPVSMEEDHGIIEPPVYDSSPSSVDKISIFSSTDAQM